MPTCRRSRWRRRTDGGKNTLLLTHTRGLHTHTHVRSHIRRAGSLTHSHYPRHCITRSSYTCGWRCRGDSSFAATRASDVARHAPEGGCRPKVGGPGSRGKGKEDAGRARERFEAAEATKRGVFAAAASVFWVLSPATKARARIVRGYSTCARS